MRQRRHDTPVTHRPGTLLPGPHVDGYAVQRDEQHHAFVVNHTLISCTPAEYRVLALLLDHVNRSVPYALLLACVQSVPPTEAALFKQAHMRLIHLISDVRSKIWPLDWEIVAIMHTGYILLSLPEEQTTIMECNR